MEKLFFIYLSFTIAFECLQWISTEKLCSLLWKSKKSPFVFKHNETFLIILLINCVDQK